MNNAMGAGSNNMYTVFKNINVKKLWFIHELTAHDTSKTAKITKR